MKTKIISKFPNLNNDAINYLIVELKHCNNDLVEYILEDIKYDVNNNPDISISDLASLIDLPFQVYYEIHQDVDDDDDYEPFDYELAEKLSSQHNYISMLIDMDDNEFKEELNNLEIIEIFGDDYINIILEYFTNDIYKNYTKTKIKILNKLQM